MLLYLILSLIDLSNSLTNHRNFSNDFWGNSGPGESVFEPYSPYTLDSTSSSKSKINRNFNGTSLNLGIFFNRNNSAELGLTGKENETELENGFTYFIHKDLSTILNFTSKLIDAGDNIQQFPNGSLYGPAADLFRNKSIDFLLVTTLCRDEIALEFNFLQPTMKPSRLQAFFIQPSITSVKNIFKIPFQNNVWALLFITWILFFFIYFLIELYYKKVNDLSLILLNCFSIISQQGSFTFSSGNSEDKSIISKNILISTGLVFSLLIYITYSAYIIYTLSVTDPPINSFIQLLENQYKFVIIKESSSMPSQIKSLEDSINMDLKVGRIDGQYSIEVLFSNAPTALIYIRPMFYRFALYYNNSQQEICQISSVTVSQEKLIASMVISKNSKYREPLNYGIIFMIERGLLKRYTKIMDKEMSQMCGDGKKLLSTNTGSLSFVDLNFAFLVNFTGLLSGVIILFFEIIYFKKNIFTFFNSYS